MLNKALSQVRGKTILVAPLDWGLGHATRCVPIIKHLNDSGKYVLIAGSGRSFEFLKKEFHNLNFVDFPSLTVRYSNRNSQVWAIVKQLPSIILEIVKEHFVLKQIVKRYKVETVISDNRFGLWCGGEVESIYITHQIMVKMPQRLSFFEPLVYLVHSWCIAHYDKCWIPDKEGIENLSGDLSHKYPLPKNAVFIGWLSRFTPQNYQLSSPYKNLAIVSGPEPQRTLFEKSMLHLLQHSNQPSILIQGLTDANVDFQQGCVRVVSHLTTEEMQWLIQESPIIYCRSGYSTLMDLAILGRKANLIPTQGQTEQEYLAMINTRFLQS